MGPQVAFHFNVPETLAYACRLLRKAVGSGVALSVIGEPPLLERLDRLLWTFDPQSFLPHVRVQPGVPVAPHLQATPVWLVASIDAVPASHRTLVQLCPSLPAGLDRFERIIEIVDRDPAQLAAGRERWRAHAAAGRALVRHDAASAPRQDPDGDRP